MGDGAEYRDVDKLGLWQVRVAWGRDERLVFEFEKKLNTSKKKGDVDSNVTWL